MELNKQINIEELLKYEWLISHKYGLKNKNKTNSGAFHIFTMINFYKNKKHKKSLSRAKLLNLSPYSKSFTNKILNDLRLMNLIRINDNYIETVRKNIFADNQNDENNNLIVLCKSDFEKYGKNLLNVIKIDYLRIVLNDNRVYMTNKQLRKYFNINKNGLKYLKENTDLIVENDKVFNLHKGYVHNELFKDDENLKQTNFIIYKAPNVYYFKHGYSIFTWEKIDREIINQKLDDIFTSINFSRLGMFKKPAPLPEHFRELYNDSVNNSLKYQKSMLITNILNFTNKINKIKEYVNNNYSSLFIHNRNKCKEELLYSYHW